MTNENSPVTADEDLAYYDDLRNWQSLANNLVDKVHVMLMKGSSAQHDMKQARDVSVCLNGEPPAGASADFVTHLERALFEVRAAARIAEAWQVDVKHHVETTRKELGL